MADEYEFKVVKVPVNNPRVRARTLNREAKSGWEVVETTRGALLSRMDHLTLRRPRAWRSEQKAARREGAQAQVAAFDDWRGSRRARKHAHNWVDVSTPDDERNSVSYLTCECGESRTVSS